MPTAACDGQCGAMATNVSGAPPTRSVVRTSTPLLGRRARTAVLIVHVLAASAWIGIDVLVAVLVGVGSLAPEPGLRGLAYQALATFVVIPMASAAILTLVSGIVLGVGSRWGLVRYWWVGVKLVLTVVMLTLIVVLLRPGMSEVGAAGVALVTDGETAADLSFLVFPPAVSLSMLTLAVVLAVAKPWGRVRERRATGQASPNARSTRP